MPSFFTVPASQRKRKRDDITAAASARRQTPTANKSKKNKPPKPDREESISESDSEDERGRKKPADFEDRDSSSSEDDDETGAERRLRLAERYLEKVKEQVEDEVGFDAEEIDRDLIAERLKEDVAETKGRLYRHIASALDFDAALKTSFRALSQSITSIAVCSPHVYTVSKDLFLTKWKLAEPPPPTLRKSPSRAPPPPARRPIKLVSKKGSRGKSKAASTMHHTAIILAVAVSSSGKFVATGGADKRLIIWSAEDLAPLRIFSQHRDAITSLAFRRGTSHLYSASKDRTIKTWSLDELAYVETLFGHQDEVVDVAALAQERCVSVGARDRTARLWKVAEETQLVFRGGGSGSGVTKTSYDKTTKHAANRKFTEGSIDRISMIDEETFITGSDNGSLSLWSIHKKKPIFTVPLAHGLDPPPTPDEYSAEKNPDPNQKPPEPQPRWITALATVPYSDLILSGSWDGHVRVWKVSQDKKRLENLGIIGRQQQQKQLSSNQEENAGDKINDDEEGGDGGGAGQIVRGVINDLAVFERGERGKDGLCVVVGLGTEHKFGRWKCVKGGKNGAVVFEVPSLVNKDGQGQGQEQEGRFEEEEEKGENEKAE